MDSLIIELIRIFLQALFFLGLVLIAIWFYFRIRPKPTQELTVDQSAATTGKEVVLTLRLQACERLVLFLERITPHNLILRVHGPDMTAAQLQASLIRTVREEFEYNLSQQLYIKSQTWELIRSAKEETIRQINMAGSNLKEGGSSRDLAGALLQLSLSQEISPVTTAIEAVKQEIR